MFETDLRNLASIIIAAAIKSETNFSDRIEALKAGTTLYGLLLKHKELDAPEEAAQGPSFADFTEAVSEHPNGGTKAGVRAGARKRGSSGAAPE